MNNNNDMQEFAENLWNKYIKNRIEEECSDDISFYRATVATNNGDGTLAVTIPFDGERTIQCTRELFNVESSANVLVLRMGSGNVADNHIAVAEMASINPDFKIIEGQVEGGTGLKVLLGGASVSGSVVENTLTKVRECACYFNYGLTGIDMPNVKTIGAYAFEDCLSLATINFPMCVNIGSYAFEQCYSLTSVNLPACTVIEKRAFWNCRFLTTVSFPVCSSIGASAFEQCRFLASANFPSCKSIGENAFWSCFSLDSVTFSVCESIGRNAFRYCSSLATASFPMCVNIGSYAFGNCNNLISLYLIQASQVTALGTDPFYSTPIGGYSDIAGQYGSVYVPSSLYAAFCSATNWTSISARIVPV